MSTARARSYQRVAQPGVPTSSSGFVHTNALDAAHFDNDDSESASDDELPLEADDDNEKNKRRLQRAKRAALISTKLHAFLWIVAAGCVAYATDFFRVIFTDDRINHSIFHVGLVCSGANVIITLYLAIYLPYIKHIDLDWSVYCPRMIPTATFLGVLATLSFVIAFWPVWGLLTPGLLFLFFIGSLMTAHFLPAI